MATQFDDEWEYSTAPAAPVASVPASSDDEWEYSQAPAGSGKTTTATNPYGKMGADEEALFSPDALRITPQRLPKPVEDEYYGFIAQNKKNQNFSQKDIDNFWTTRGYAPTTADDGFIETIRKGGDTGKIDYSSWDEAQQALEDDRMKRAMEDFSKEAYQGDYASAVDESTKYGFWGITSRTLKDWFDTNKDDLRKEFPNASDEELERFSDQDIIRRARAARNYYTEANKDSGWFPWLAGQFTGAVIDPTSYIAPGASTGGRIAGNIGASMVTQGVFEGIDAAQGLPSGQAGENIALAGAFGGALQGLVEVGGKIYRRIRGPQGEALEEVVDATPEQIQAARLQQEADAFQARKSEEVAPSALEQEAQTFQGSREPTLEDVFPTPEQTAAKEAAMTEKLAAEAEAFKARGKEPEVVPEAPAAPKVTVDQARESIDFITQDWTNAPDIEIVQSARDLGDDSIDPDALGFIGEDGKVRIIANNLNGPEDVRAVLFHEALGHHGLASKFGEELDDMFMRAYDSGGKFKEEVDQFIKDRPDYVEAYADDVNPTARLIEEIFAGKSESGIVLPPNILAKMKVYLKDMARKMGITKWTEMTDKDIQTILGMAHDATINGKPNAVANGFKYAKAYHGSAADFDEFDHSFMGSGEGAQVFGWGTYLSDSEGIARSYRDKLSEVKPTWGGMETTYWNLRNNATGYATAKYGQKGSEISELYVNYMNEHGGNTPYDGMNLFKETMPDGEFWRIDEAWVTLPEAEKKLWKEVTDDLNTKVGMSKKGKLYEVEIPDDAKWIDWDFQPTDEVKKAFADLGVKPVEKSPEEMKALYNKRTEIEDEIFDIQEQIHSFEEEIKAEFGPMWRRVALYSANAGEGSKIYEMHQQLLDWQDSNNRAALRLQTVLQDIDELYPTGEQLYKKLVKKLGSDKKASLALAEKGIAGNKYAANSMSGNPDFSKFNYVVFDDKTPKITKKYMKKPSIQSSDASRTGDRVRLNWDTVSKSGGPGTAAKVFLKELGVHTNYELGRMPNKEAIDKAGRLGIDQDWIDYYNDATWNPNTKELDTPTPRPDMDRYLPKIKYMKRQAGKGSEGPLQGSATREVKEKGDVNTPISKFRSNRDLSQITEEIMPERTKESWDEWIDEAGSIKMTAKAAENLATGVDVPHLKAAEMLLLRTKNRIFDLSRKAGNQTLSPREMESLRVELQRAKNIAQSIQDVVSNAARILNSRNIEVSDDRATGAMIKNMLRNIENGKLDDPVELQKMAAALRKGDKKDKAIAESLNVLTEALNLPRSIMSSMDLSAPLRQGIFLVGNKRWWGALIPMIKQFAKEKHYDFFLNDIKSRPTFPAMMKGGLAIMSKEGKRLDKREEAFLGTWAEKIPVFGKGVKASNRAYTGFLNKLRADVFDDLVRKYHAAGIELYGYDKNNNFVVKNPKALKDITKFINAATGRGSLGNFDQAAAELSNAFFSPRLLSARVTMLNPHTYVKLDPIVRREALKSLFSFAGIAGTVAGLAAMMFPDDVTVETDPRSSDFMKIKVGNTRYDILGGFGQYITLGSRIITNSKKNAKGEIKELGKDYGSDNALDVIGRFFGNKEAPLASLLTDYLRGENAVGEEFSWDTAILSRMVPMMWQDMAELVSDRGAVGIPMALPAVFGVGSQTYNVELGFDAFGRDIAELQKKDEPETDPVILQVSALGERTGENPLAKGPKSFKFEGQKYELTDEQAAEWQKIMGDLQHQFLSEDILSDEWIMGDDNDKLKITKKAHDDAFAQTKEHFLTNVFGVPPVNQEEEVVEDDDFIYE